jgi:hypothetical protein
LEAFGEAIAPGGACVVIASQSGHRLPALSAEQNSALALTPADELLALPMLQPDAVTSSLHAYQLSKRANTLRVMAEAVRWGRRGARVNSISPGIIFTPLARDELNGPRGDGYRRMIDVSPAGRGGTPDEVGTVGALLMGPDGAFITGSDVLMAASPPPIGSETSPLGDRRARPTHRACRQVGARPAACRLFFVLPGEVVYAPGPAGFRACPQTVCRPQITSLADGAPADSDPFRGFADTGDIDGRAAVRAEELVAWTTARRGLDVELRRRAGQAERLARRGDSDAIGGSRQLLAIGAMAHADLGRVYLGLERHAAAMAGAVDLQPSTPLSAI